MAQHALGGMRTPMATILIADDQESVRRLLQLTLADRHTVIEAEDGGEALDLLRRYRPDVAVLDVVMPGLNGLQLCRLLRADPDLCGMGIIVVSATASDDDVQQAGADRFLAKPFLPSALLRAIDDLLGGAPAPRRLLRPAPGPRA
jgi:CheY-like chemotaxis protein